jgi:hypothetical protein
MNCRTPSLLQYRLVESEGRRLRLNLNPAVGSVRLWVCPDWSSASVGGTGPGAIARLIEVGNWLEGASGSWALSFSPDGDNLIFSGLAGGKALDYLQADLQWEAGTWHLVALTYGPQGSELFLDGEPIAQGGGVVSWTDLAELAQQSFCVGSSHSGQNCAEAELEELATFNRSLSADEVADYCRKTLPIVEQGPITPEEEAQRLQAVLAARAAGGSLSSPAIRPAERDAALAAMGDCASELTIKRNSQGQIEVKVVNATPGKLFDLYRTFHLEGDAVAEGHWQKIGSGTDGQVFTFPNQPCSPVFYVLGCDQDSDQDGLTDAYETLVTKTSPGSAHTLTPLYTDRELENVLVNDPEQDCGTEQNTQDETTVLVAGNTVIAAWVDSNLGVPGYGVPDVSCAECWLPSSVPQWIGWAVSRDGGRTFTDKGAVPLFANQMAFAPTDCSGGGSIRSTTLGNAGDPVLAHDVSSGTIYLTGNPQRPSIYYLDGENQPGKLWVPVWRSTDGGESFLPPVDAAAGLQAVGAADIADGPTLVVDNFPGLGHGYVYLAFAWSGAGQPVVICRSINGTGWQLMAQLGLAESFHQICVAPNHDVCVVWRESTGGCPDRRALFFSKSTDRGMTFSTPTQVFCMNDSAYRLSRSISSDSNDQFRAPPVPRFAANPVNGHLYYVYHDKPASGTARPNIYFLQSTDGGTTWSPSPIQVNVEPGGVPTDQWQPVLAVKPDGAKLFIGWYDRRNDPINHSMIQVYGVFANLPITGSSAFANNFPISTVQFSPAFSGTMTNAGAYDPSLPPLFDQTLGCVPGWYGGVYRDHMGDYDTAVADNTYVYYTWADNRNLSTSSTRYQAEVTVGSNSLVVGRSLSTLKETRQRV